MRSADLPCADIRPFRIEPESGKIAKHVTHSGRPQSEHVFEYAEGGAQIGDDSRDFRPEPPGVFLGFALAGDGGGLAGEASAEDIHGSQS
jgi:hypothetical protein